MPRVIGIDHLVLSVSDLARSRDFYGEVLGFLGFKLTHDGGGFVGWSNGKTLFWIAQADARGVNAAPQGRRRLPPLCVRAREPQGGGRPRGVSRQHGMTVADPPDSYNGDDKYYAVFFNDPDGMRLEAMHYGAARKRSKKRKR